MKTNIKNFGKEVDKIPKQIFKAEKHADIILKKIRRRNQ